MLVSSLVNYGTLRKKTGNKELDKLTAIAGYSYDPEQDIFYSTKKPWQRKFGFCRLYDEAGAPLSMIMDCEPISFNYRGEKWLIEFWKGQYGLATGGEIGVYTGGIDLNILGIYEDTFYKYPTEEDQLQMSFTLWKDGSKLFTREDKHWWLTGFKLGEFSEPSQLSMDINITFKDTEMRDAFIDAFRKVGYSDNDFRIVGNSLMFKFDVPLTPQPSTRTNVTDWIIQRKNELLCTFYQLIKQQNQIFNKKLRVIENQLPGRIKIGYNPFWKQ